MQERFKVLESPTNSVSPFLSAQPYHLGTNQRMLLFGPRYKRAVNNADIYSNQKHLKCFQLFSSNLRGNVRTQYTDKVVDPDTGEFPCYSKPSGRPTKEVIM